MISRLITDQYSAVSAEEDEAFRFARTAWTNTPLKAKLVLTTPVEVMYLTSDLPVWKLAEIRVLDYCPSQLQWAESSGSLRSLDFVQFYLSREGNDSYGIKVGLTPLLIGSAAPSQEVSVEQIITFRSENLELTLILPAFIYGDWKKALSSYLKSYLKATERPESQLPSSPDSSILQSRNSYDPSSIPNPSFGPIFDISWTKEQSYTSIKLTCIEPSLITHTEYCYYERKGKSGGKSKAQIREIVGNGELNPADLMIFEHCLDEIEIIDIYAQTKLQDLEYFSCMNSDICSFLAPGGKFEWVIRM